MPTITPEAYVAVFLLALFGLGLWRIAKPMLPSKTPKYILEWCANNPPSANLDNRMVVLQMSCGRYVIIDQWSVTKKRYRGVINSPYTSRQYLDVVRGDCPLHLYSNKAKAIKDAKIALQQDRADDARKSGWRVVSGEEVSI